MTENIACSRDANGRFLPGQSGNPAGKKPGTRNRATVLREALAEGEDIAAARIVIDKALAGDVVAARFLVGRLMPRPRGREITLDLRDGNSAADVLAASDATIQAMAAGEITPDEALTVTRLLDFRLKAIAAAAREAARALSPHQQQESSPLRRQEPSPAHHHEPSPPGREQGEGVRHLAAGAGTGSVKRPRPAPLPRGDGRTIAEDLLHSTCISRPSGRPDRLAA